MYKAPVDVCSSRPYEVDADCLKLCCPLAGWLLVLLLLLLLLLLPGDVWRDGSGHQPAAGPGQ
jgi:hypothetical protein